MVVNVVKSSWQLVKIGVPQGLGMGTGLFNIFTNYLDKGIEFIPSQFADDTKLSWSVNMLENRKALYRLN